MSRRVFSNCPAPRPDTVVSIDSSFSYAIASGMERDL